MTLLQACILHNDKLLNEMEQSIFIKNMVCTRCIEVVSEIFKKLEIPINDIKLGRVKTAKQIIRPEQEQLIRLLNERGFELLSSKQAQIINQIKSIIIDDIHSQRDGTLYNISTLLTSQLNYDYAYLSRLFSSLEGKTIEKYVIGQKIEKIKELLVYGEMSLSEIAFEMNYSSSAHLSSQFKRMVGMSPSEFRNLQKRDRKTLDEV